MKSQLSGISGILPMTVKTMTLKKKQVKSYRESMRPITGPESKIDGFCLSSSPDKQKMFLCELCGEKRELKLISPL